MFAIVNLFCGRNPLESVLYREVSAIYRVSARGFTVVEKNKVKMHFVPSAKRKANQEDMRILHQATRSC